MPFLPTTKNELKILGIDKLDFIMVCPDAYVDHPSFGGSLIARLIESEGFSIGIMSQPMSDIDYVLLGEPNHAFLISGGVVDSMVANYTVALNKRKQDAYSEGGLVGKRQIGLPKYMQKT